MRLLAVGILGIVLSTSGCKAITALETKLDSLSDAQLAAYLQEGALYAAKYGITAAQAKYPKDAARIKGDATQIDGFLRNTVIPALSGAPTSAVLSGLIQQVSTLVQNTTLSEYEIVVQGVIISLPLPANPADKLSSRAAGAAVGFFTGLAQGIEQAEGLPSPAPVTPTPAPATPAPAAPAPASSTPPTSEKKP